MAGFGDVLRGLGSVLNPQVMQSVDQEDQRAQALNNQLGLLMLQNKLAQNTPQGQLAMDTLKRQRDYATARAALGPNPTQEQLTTLASQFVDPAEAYKVGQDAENRRLQVAVTREATMSRLSQQAQQYMSTYLLRFNAAKTADERLALEREKEAFAQNLRTEAARLAGARANYDFGFQPAPSPQPTVTPPADVAPSPPAQALPPGVPQSDATAYNTVRNAAFAGQPISGGVSVDRAATPQEQAMPLMGAVPVPPSIQPAQAPQGAQTPAASALPPMPPEIASAPRKVQDAWRLQQTKASIAGSGSFTPQALEFVAKQYLSGDRQAIQGFARNATARIALQNAIVDEATKQGLSPQQTAAKMAEFAGTVAGSRTVGQRAANISLAATEAEEMIGIVKETSDKFARTNFVPWNMALRAYESGTGSPEIAAFGASINALVNVYARAINPTGVPTISDKEHARAILNTVQSPAQVQAVLGIIGRELEIAKGAPATVQAGTSARITGSSDGWSIRPK